MPHLSTLQFRSITPASTRYYNLARLMGPLASFRPDTFQSKRLLIFQLSDPQGLRNSGLGVDSPRPAGRRFFSYNRIIGTNFLQTQLQTLPSWHCLLQTLAPSLSALRVTAPGPAGRPAGGPGPPGPCTACSTVRFNGLEVTRDGSFTVTASRDGEEDEGAE